MTYLWSRTAEERLFSTMVLRRIPALATLSAIALYAASPAAADPSPSDDTNVYPVAQGHYTSVGDPGWIYFLTPMGGLAAHPDGQPVTQFGCGIGPDGTVGCDAVPSPEQVGDVSATAFAPPDANETIAGPQQPAQYRHADTLTFTRDVDVLPEGRQLVNGDAFCPCGMPGFGQLHHRRPRIHPLQRLRYDPLASGVPRAHGAAPPPRRIN